MNETVTKLILDSIKIDFPLVNAEDLKEKTSKAVNTMITEDVSKYVRHSIKIFDQDGSKRLYLRIGKLENLLPFFTSLRLASFKIDAGLFLTSLLRRLSQNLIAKDVTISKDRFCSL